MAEPDVVDDDACYVIFSLGVHSSHPIAALAAFRDLGLNRRIPRPADHYFYDFGWSSFSEDDTSARAHKLDAIVNEAIDRMDGTGIDPDDLDASDVDVRAFFTFDPGAETISSEIVQRLARYHATIWIDANG
jgi:hypothetical protein